MKTIFMRRADWQKWDDALRSGTYQQGEEELHNNTHDTYCCLGVLQHCLTGEVETTHGDDELPSLKWLEEHHIHFMDIMDSVTREHMRDPFLQLLDTTAASANDKVKWVGSDMDGHVVHINAFAKIADAIADAVEFTD